ncbi:unnamed protein product [Schistosoma curassoni]|uniref:Uncharacterized protein n=1 Tax=Schistosoma curassoni TaxID=6186 RepID=A0A183JDM7_9TREM|nr:unnamed protein product [Schistosoma curassoni]
MQRAEEGEEGLNQRLIREERSWRTLRQEEGQLDGLRRPRQRQEGEGGLGLLLDHHCW